MSDPKEKNMAIHTITIKPTSPFGTPLKGDTIFGHFCWQAVQDQNLLNGGLDNWITAYPHKPFAVFSSAWPRINDNGKLLFALKRPDLPPAMLETADSKKLSCEERLTARKDNKAKKWLLVGEDLCVTATMDRLSSDHDLFERCLSQHPEKEQQAYRLLPKKQQKLLYMAEQQHNSINRLTMTTGKGFFAPFAMENIHYLPGLELAIFVYINEEATDIERVQAAFVRIGQWGFGRDASTGLGRFEVTGCNEVKFPETDTSTACYTIGPCVPQPNSFKQAYFTPFTRFGKHGGPLVLTGKPFKIRWSWPTKARSFIRTTRIFFKNLI
jgi:CRISPR-associated protein Csm4